MPDDLPTLSNIDAPPSLQDIAFQTLKQAIIRKELLAGNVYSEQAIAKNMGMSKTPVHQALQDLEKLRSISEPLKSASVWAGKPYFSFPK